MDAVAFHILGRPIHWYGILVATGFASLIVHWNFTVEWEKLPRGFGSELGFWIMLSGILGARAAYVAAHLDRYVESPFDILRVWEGGLVFYGGFMAATAVVIVVAKRRGSSVWALGDFAICPVPLGHAIGRVGCLFNGCCYGAPSEAPWCLAVDAVRRHPTQLYETGLNVLVYGLLVFAYGRKKKDGQIFALYLAAYPIGRFVIEFFRGDHRIRWLGLTVAQHLSMVFFIGACLLWFALPKRTPSVLSRKS